MFLYVAKRFKFFIGTEGEEGLKRYGYVQGERGTILDEFLRTYKVEDPYFR